MSRWPYLVALWPVSHALANSGPIFKWFVYYLRYMHIIELVCITKVAYTVFVCVFEKQTIFYCSFAGCWHWSYLQGQCHSHWCVVHDWFALQCGYMVCCDEISHVSSFPQVWFPRHRPLLLTLRHRLPRWHHRFYPVPEAPSHWQVSDWLRVRLGSDICYLIFMSLLSSLQVWILAIRVLLPHLSQ